MLRSGQSRPRAVACRAVVASRAPVAAQQRPSSPRRAPDATSATIEQRLIEMTRADKALRSLVRQRKTQVAQRTTARAATDPATPSPREAAVLARSVTPPSVATAAPATGAAAATAPPTVTADLLPGLSVHAASATRYDFDTRPTAGRVNPLRADPERSGALARHGRPAPGRRRRVLAERSLPARGAAGRRPDHDVACRFDAAHRAQRTAGPCAVREVRTGTFTIAKRPLRT